jgi:hypothetical protein
MGANAHPAANCVGRPDLASAAIGERLADHVGQELATLIEQLLAASWPPENGAPSASPA